MSTTETPTFTVGQKCTYTLVVTDELVHGMAELTGDRNPIHLDDAFATKTKFGQRIAHGIILFGMMSKALGMDMPGLGTVYLSQTANFRAPVFIGDTVTLVATITEILPKAVARLSVVITKQTGEVVLDGITEVKLPGWLTKI